MPAHILPAVSAARDNLGDLISQASRDNQQAFGELHAMFHQRVFQFLHRACGDVWLADELTNQAFHKAFRSLSTFRGHDPRQFQSFLLTIAANLLRDHRRRNRPLELSLDEGTASKAGSDYGDSGECDGYAAVQTRERSQMLRRALATLPSEQAMLISLSHFDDLSAEQIAAILNKSSPEAVRAALSRAMKQLRQALIRQGYFSPALA